MSAARPRLVIRLPEDVRGSDLAIAAALAVAVLTLTILALEIAHLRRRADAPIIDPGIATPIRVTPVVDLPGTPAGAGGEAALPPAWARSEAPPPADTPAAATPQAPTSRRRKHQKPTPAANPEAPATTPSEPPPPEPEGAEAGEPTGGEVGAEAGEPTGGEVGEAAGGGDGQGGDPLGSRAIAAYRERLIRWLSARFQVRGSGLSRDQLASYRVRAQIEISEDGLVTGYTLLAADHPVFEAAARTALDAVVGEPVPPPPEFYPGALQRRIRVTFVCTESTCD
ncbi:MAG: hypothetical protein H6711_17150 [Myxococcales bacterium]|nr:hypothetical protein [Myxococcales bacterium]